MSSVQFRQNRPILFFCLLSYDGSFLGTEQLFLQTTVSSNFASAAFTVNLRRRFFSNAAAAGGGAFSCRKRKTTVESAFPLGLSRGRGPLISVLHNLLPEVPHSHRSERNLTEPAVNRHPFAYY